MVNTSGAAVLPKEAFLFVPKPHMFGLGKLKTILSPSRTPKSIIISILLVSNWPSKMFVMVLKKLGDHFKPGWVKYKCVTKNTLAFISHKKLLLQ